MCRQTSCDRGTNHTNTGILPIPSLCTPAESEMNHFDSRHMLAVCTSLEETRQIRPVKLNTGLHHHGERLLNQSAQNLFFFTSLMLLKRAGSDSCVSQHVWGTVRILDRLPSHGLPDRLNPAGQTQKLMLSPQRLRVPPLHDQQVLKGSAVNFGRPQCRLFYRVYKPVYYGGPGGQNTATFQKAQ